MSEAVLGKPGIGGGIFLKRLMGAQMALTDTEVHVIRLALKLMAFTFVRTSELVRARISQRTANMVLTVCVSQGDNRKLPLALLPDQDIRQFTDHLLVEIADALEHTRLS